MVPKTLNCLVNHFFRKFTHFKKFKKYFRKQVKNPVTFVAILSDDSIELEGVVVEVCNSVDDTCTECGIVSATAASSWSTVFCPHPGLQGNRIKISKWGFAAFCEIVIFGVKIERVQ